MAKRKSKITVSYDAGKAAIRSKPINTSVKPAVLKDTLTNLVANMNTGNDKRRHSTFTGRGRLDRTQLEAMYREDWIAGKIVDIIADEMTREWRKFIDKDLDSDQVEQIEKAENELGIKYMFNEAKKWARLYGGALIIMDIEGTGEPHEPLDLNKVKEGSLKSLNVYDAENAQFHTVNQTDPFAENFLRPETYRLSRTPIEIHHTRVLRFDGQLLPLNELQRNRYWHDSVLGRVYEALVNANIANDSSASLLFETNVDVIKIKDLMVMLSTPDGADILSERFFLAKMLKSNNNVTLLDAEEQIEKHNQTFAGVPEMMDRFMTILSAASDIPATRLFGKAPIGMNATGESDLTNFYDHIKEKQEFEFRPLLKKFDDIFSRHLGIDPEDMDYVFNPLWQISDTEQSTIKLANAQADEIHERMGSVKVSTIAKQLQQEGTYSNITTEDIEEIEEFENPENEIGGGGSEVSLNGAQVTSMVNVLQGVTEGTLTEEAAKGILSAAFPVSEKDIDFMLSGIKEAVVKEGNEKPKEEGSE